MHSSDNFIVAAAFPTGLYPLESKVVEIYFAKRNGATEIDIVISRFLVLQHRWLELYQEISALRSACGCVKMKTILAVGECGSLENIYKASMIAMKAGTDYIKTSTGTLLFDFFPILVLFLWLIVPVILYRKRSCECYFRLRTRYVPSD